MKYLKQEEDGMLKQAEIAERQGSQCEDDVRANWGSRQYLDLLFCGICWSSLLAQLVKNLPAGQETQIWFLGQEDPLEKEMATHSSIFAWRIPWTEEPGWL